MNMQDEIKSLIDDILIIRRKEEYKDSHVIVSTCKIVIDELNNIRNKNDFILTKDLHELILELDTRRFDGWVFHKDLIEEGILEIQTAIQNLINKRCDDLRSE